MARLKVKYTEEIAPALMNKFQYKSVMQIPKLSKVIPAAGIASRTLPFLPLSLPDRTITVSFFLTFISWSPY